MYRRKLFILAGLALVASMVSADSDRWMRLGQTDLDPRGDRVEIRLRGQQRIEALVLGLENASVRILAARIQFANGRVIDWPIRGILYPRQRTHVFQLPGRLEHRVRRVVLYYETGHQRRRMHREQDRPWDVEMAPRDGDGGPDRGPGRGREMDRDRGPAGPGAMERDRGPEAESRWQRDWDPRWERDYGRLKPNVVIWGRD